MIAFGGTSHYFIIDFVIVDTRAKNAQNGREFHSGLRRPVGVAVEILPWRHGGPDQSSPLVNGNVATFSQLRKIFVSARKNFTMAREKISSPRCEMCGARDRDVTDARERRRCMYYLH